MVNKENLRPWRAALGRRVVSVTVIKLTPALSQLRDQGKKLNAATEQCNTTLEHVQKELLATQIGLEFWFPTPLSESLGEGDVGVSDTTTQLKTLLGFSKCDGEWSLAVKVVREVSGFFEGDMSCPYTEKLLAREPEPLLKQSRQVRLRAIALMPDFLESLSEEVDKQIKAAEQASALLVG